MSGRPRCDVEDHEGLLIDPKYPKQVPLAALKRETGVSPLHASQRSATRPAVHNGEKRGDPLRIEHPVRYLVSRYVNRPKASEAREQSL